MIKREKSEKLYEEAKKYFPGGVNSPVRAFKSVQGAPLFIKRGEGAHIIDEDDNRFLDFCGSWGPLILGHANPNVIKAISETIKNGITFGTPTKLGNEIGELFIENHEYVDKIRFVSSGTEAVMSAIRLARGYTGKDKIVKFEGCYHGHVDSLLVKAGSGLVTFGESTSAGVPKSFAEETIVLDLNDLQGLEDTLKEHHKDIAAIIVEPIPANNGLLLQDQAWLVWLRHYCDKYKVLLIFDEVISGFRVGFEGAARIYSVSPDILTFGKIIGGGMPVGAYGANHEIMSHISPEGPVYQAGTLSANPVAMAAGIATMKELLKPGFYEELNDKTIAFCKTLSDHIESKGYPMHVVQIGSIFWMAFSDKRIVKASDIDPSSMKIFAELHGELLNRNIYLGPSGYEVAFISAAHTEDDLAYASKHICEALDKILAK
ncbi:MAG TPA: glutamate-1-semialdehyde-2,1-aminomutase [Saprospirales bacterium]|jgi:glutamate-1-semialdehyde 2,1-aminomutase|nr:glutamate-1-semialdehyde 2,1-aminomutase [Saprospiraceae bacterium]MDA9358773.1 glutamate-1-semialdehyde 2,1-aminomutase [Saprospiraceae bacterium]MDC1309063.1 glutamate-1-semialdehyde 2,1-aminomutase [Saprospiraceae bacterium]HCV50805.1 glutamate-1-semialdehyde-2,1-aminomutase [Saprospirales bacterium]